MYVIQGLILLYQCLAQCVLITSSADRTKKQLACVLFASRKEKESQRKDTLMAPASIFPPTLWPPLSPLKMSLMGNLRGLSTWRSALLKESMACTKVGPLHQDFSSGASGGSTRFWFKTPTAGSQWSEDSLNPHCFKNGRSWALISSYLACSMKIIFTQWFVVLQFTRLWPFSLMPKADAN